MTSVLSFFWPPTLETIEQTQRARTFHRVTLTATAMIVLLLLLLAVEQPASSSRWINSILFGVGTCLVLIPINRRGRTRLASWLLILGMTAIITQRAWTGGGIMASSVSAFVVIVLMAGLLLSTRSGVIMALICLSIGLGMALAEHAGLLPPSVENLSPIATWLAGSLWLGMAFLLQREVAISVAVALRRSESELAERKRAEADALKEKVLSDTVINGMPGAFYMFGREGRLVRWNDEFARIVGLNTENAATHRLLDRIVVADKEKVRTAVERTYAQGQANVEASAITASGTRHFHFAARRLQSGEETYLLGSGYDITARAEAEAALQASEAQFRVLASHLQLVREAESRRIARAVHDEVGQRLTSLKMDLRWIEDGLEKISGPEANALLDRVVAATQLVDETVTTVQRIATELRPAILDQVGLFAALRHESVQFQQRTGIACQFNGPQPEPMLSPDLATACYRIAQEALTNVVRHAAATTVVIGLHLRPAGFVLEIRDNGRGIARNAVKDIHAHGLLGMQERARHHGGEVVIEPGTSGGTVVQAQFPLLPAPTDAP